jgi:hypothetical protein
VGSKGIRRRKPARHLPKVPDIDPDDDIPPNIMWPPKGSGFQADPFSPAGSSQRSWWLIRRAIGGNPLSFRSYLLLMGILAVVVVVAVLAALR